MYQGLQQFMGEPVEIIYLASDNRTIQCKIDILSAGDQCVFAYSFNSKEPELFKNSNILAVMPIPKQTH